MRNVLLVSPYFLPSNLAGVHRVRLMSGHLAAHGWQPTIVTVDSGCYEERSDPALLHLLPIGVPIERVSAWPARLCRPLGIGDVSLRGQTALRKKVNELFCKLRPAVVFTTVLPGYTALVGAFAKRRFGIPFVLDYQDPWVAPDTGGLSLNKAGLANRLARWLEPGVMRSVDALTAVSDATLDSLRSRNLLRPSIPIEIIPIGADAHDHIVAAEYGRSLIQHEPETLHIAYLGTLTARMLPALATVFAAIGKIGAESHCKITLHLIGTSAQPGGSDQHNLAALTARFGITSSVHLHPGRVGYLDALRTMQDADLLLLIGSTDSHYTASKLFPYWLSKKPILGVFHRASTIVDLAERLGGTCLVLYDETNPPETTIDETADVLRRFTKEIPTSSSRDEHAFAAYSAEGIASRYARLFDRIAV